MAGDEAPGPDRFPTFFYQEYWEVIKDDIMWMMQDGFNGTVDLDHINNANIVLIPKVDGANQVNLFSHISLLNVSYKDYY